jgi:hypothetical protein
VIFLRTNSCDEYTDPRKQQNHQSPPICMQSPHIKAAVECLWEAKGALWGSSGPLWLGFLTPAPSSQHTKHVDSAGKPVLSPLHTLPL